jgi:hypothetical protein
MSNGMTNTLANALLDHVLGTSYTPPGTLYLALFTDATDATGAGTEVTGGSYARQALTYGAASSRQIANSAAATYTAMPAVTVTHYGVMSASTAGVMLFFGPLTTARTLTAGDTLTFAIGDKVDTLTAAA